MNTTATRKRTDLVQAATIFAFLLITVGMLLPKKKELYPLDSLHNAVLIHKHI